VPYAALSWEDTVRRVLAAVVASGAAAMVLAGCTAHADVDGNLTDDWAAMTEPTGVVPQAGTCHYVYVTVGYRTGYLPVKCVDQHQSETVYVGRFTGASAELAIPPVPGSRPHRLAFAQCDGKAKAYLGGDWRNARLWLGLTLPSKYAWEGGAR
jgi:hypothetical protein